MKRSKANERMAQKLRRVQRLLEQAHQQQCAQRAQLRAQMYKLSGLADEMHYARWQPIPTNLSPDFAHQARSQLLLRVDELHQRACTLDENIHNLHKRQARIATLRKRVLENARRDAMRAAEKED